MTTGTLCMKHGVVAIVAGMLLATCTHLAWSATPPTPSADDASTAQLQEYQGRTEPSERRDLSFVGQGVILEAPVRDGDRVKVGQLLMRQEDRLERKFLESLEMEADSTLEIEMAQKELEARDIIFKRMRELREQRGAASEKEFMEAQVAKEMAEIQLRQKQFEQQLRRLKAEQQRIRVEQMQLVSPIDGIVQKRHVGVGELGVPSPEKPAVTVVRNDPLYVVVFLPVDVTSQLRVGDVLMVSHEPRFGGLHRSRSQAQENWKPAQVIFLDPVADAESNTRQVKLTLDNPEDRESGRQVRVRLPSDEERKMHASRQAVTE